VLHFLHSISFYHSIHMYWHLAISYMYYLLILL